MTLFSQTLLDQQLEGGSRLLMPLEGQSQFHDRVGHASVAYCTPLFPDERGWTVDDYRIAAAVCGMHAAELLRLVVTSSQRDTHGTDFALDYINSETLRIALGLARDAWHYAQQAVGC